MTDVTLSGAGGGTSWLVATDVDAVQSYLLQSVHLSTIAGASSLLVQADDKCRKLADQHQGFVVMATGGISLVEFGDKSQARLYAEEISSWFRQHTVSGHLTTSGPVERKAGEEFGEVARKTFQRLEDQKRRGFPHGQFAAIPQGQPCQSCGTEIAVKRVLFGRGPAAEMRWLGESCQKKYDRRHRLFWLEWLKDTNHPNHQRWEHVSAGRHVAYDFNLLAGDHDLGLIVADADGTGRLIRQLVEDKLPAEKWREFSDGLARLSRNTVTDAIDKIVPDRFLADTQSLLLPVLPLFCGGDDMVIACRGDLALPLASFMCRRFAEAEKPWLPQAAKLGLSAAVVVTRPGFPFRIAHRLGSQLLKAAKREARRLGWRDQGIGAVDYALITESMADLDTLTHDRVLCDPAKRLSIVFTGRPYRAADSGERSIGSLDKAVLQLRGGDFPRTRLHELRSLLTLSEWTGEAVGEQVDRSVDQVRGIREEVELRFKDWLSRTERQVNWSKSLRELNETLGLRTVGGSSLGCWYASSETNPKRETCQSPLGDLADGLRLFGTLDRAANGESA
ncbi:MAG: hypothetical protein J5I93_05015 [Pirellulaceae bacterium]|nr:hypothetical protein [Pirellulaceae bacterium]